MAVHHLSLPLGSLNIYLHVSIRHLPLTSMQYVLIILEYEEASSYSNLI